MGISVIETAPIGYGPSQRVVSQQIGSQLRPLTLHTASVQQQEKPLDDIAYKRMEVVDPGRVGQTRAISMEGKPNLNSFSQHVRGRITVPGATECDPVKVDLPLDSGLGLRPFRRN